MAVTLAMMIAAHGAAAAIEPRAQQLLAQAAQATGVAAWPSAGVLRTHGTFGLGGLKGPIDIAEDVKTGRFRSALDLGVLKQANGFDGVVPWVADASGIVDPQESAEAVREAINDAYRARRGYLAADGGNADASYVRLATEGQRRFQVLRITPRGGRPAELWIDAATHFPDRWIEKASTYVRTIVFSDYRPVRGVMMPFRVLTSDGTPANDQTMIVEQYALGGDVSPAQFERPVSVISDASLESGVTELPIMIEGGHVVLPVSINGSEPLPFILDSGATVNVLTPAAAKLLSVTGEGSIAAEGVGQGTADVSLTRAKQVAVGGARLRDQQFAILALPALTQHRAKPIAGLLGYDMLRRFVTRIDYGARTLRLGATGQCAPTRSPNALPIVFSDRIPEVEASIDGKKGLWSVDTGSGGELTLFKAFAEANNLGKDIPLALQVSAGGIGGKVESSLARFGSAQFGPYKLDQPYAKIVQARTGAYASTSRAGNIGANALRNFIVTFDYECRTMTLEPGAEFGREEPVNRAGLAFSKAPGTAWLEVMNVRADGPAATAGVSAGDRLIALSGRPVEAYSYGEVREFLGQSSGTHVTMRLLRGDQTLDVAFVLADPLAINPVKTAKLAQ